MQTKEERPGGHSDLISRIATSDLTPSTFNNPPPSSEANKVHASLIHLVVAPLENSVFMKIWQRTLSCLHITQNEVLGSHNYKQVFLPA